MFLPVGNVTHQSWHMLARLYYGPIMADVRGLGLLKTTPIMDEKLI